MATKHVSKPKLIDLTGERFGSWTVTGRDHARPYTATRRVTYWLCRCDCGTFKSIRSLHLRNGETTSCGCVFNGIDLTGRVCGRLAVIGRAESRRNAVYWTCRCECGTVKAVASERLRSGATKSCGCLAREVAASVNRKHGLTSGGSWAPGYSSWNGMIGRCGNAKDPAFANYGGRGIYVCDRWLDSVAFFEDVGLPPSREYSIDRIDNNGSYTCGKCSQCQERGQPMNCRWATRLEQSCNRRNNRLLTHDGKTLTLKEWCLRTGLKRSTIEARLKRGWSDSLALTVPSRLPKRQSP